MCLALTGEVKKVSGKKATVDFGGVSREVNVEFVKAGPGDRVMVFNGFAIDIVEDG